MARGVADDPDKQAKALAKRQAWRERMMADPEAYAEWKRKVSEGCKRRDEDKDLVARRLAAGAHRPEVKAVVAQHLRDLHDSPEWLAKASASAKRRWADPAFHEAQSKRIKEAAQRPEWREKVTANSRAYNASLTPEQKRERGLAGARASQLANPSGIELDVAKALDKLGIAYERQKQIGPCVVDFYLPDSNTVFEVWGCYWHGCKVCGYEGQGRKDSDRARKHAFIRDGYTFRWLREHEVRADVLAATQRVLKCQPVLQMISERGPQKPMPTSG